MGKVLDSRKVEYAYLKHLHREDREEEWSVNEGGFKVVTYRINVTLIYEVYTADKSPLGTKSMHHAVRGLTGNETLGELNALVNNAQIKTWVRADKLELSGYDIGE